MPHTRRCFANHMGIWAIEPAFFNRAAAAIRAGTWPVLSAADIEARARAADEREVPYDMAGDVAVISLDGPLMKGWSKFGGTSTVHTRRLLRAAMRDPKVGGAVLRFDSPGGTVAGTQETADDVRAFARVKPIRAYAEDLLASAAFWIATPSQSISASRTSEIGSIGTLAVVDDTSKKFEQDGVTTHVIATGAHKGAFVDGAPVKKEHLDYLRERVWDLNAHFLDAVESGRGMSRAAVEKAADGRVFSADRAKELGLIDDADSTLDAVIARVQADSDAIRSQRRAEARAASFRAERYLEG